MRFRSWLVLGVLAVVLLGVSEARAAITYQSAGAVAYSGTGQSVGTVSPAYPASITAGDLLVLIVGQKPATHNGGGVTTPTDWTLITSLSSAGGYASTGADTGNTNVFAYYKVAVGGETGTLAVSLTDNSISWAQMYRLSNASGGWSVAGTTGSDTTAGDVSIAMSADPGVTAGDYILGGMVIPTDVTTPSQFSGEGLSQTGITFGTVTEIAEPDSTTSNDIGGFTFGAPVSSGTSSAAPTLTATAGGTTTNVRGPGVFIRCRETASTTLGNGTDPGNAALAPSGTATMADAFTFQSSSGTDTITAVVVDLGAGGSTGLGLVEITNDAGSTVYGSTADPVSDTPTVTLSTNTLTATTTQTQYKIRVTPKTHANMPAPGGGTYAVAAKISSWTGTNGQLGSDTAGTTITIDNLSPANVTAASGTAGDGQVALSWTNPADGDFQHSVVLRDTSAVADTPVEGATYTVGNTVGTSTVVCVVASPTASCTDTTVSNGTSYSYKIFTRDTNGNYSATGVIPTGSPFTPAGPGCYSIATGNWSATSTWASSVGGAAGTCPGAGNIPDSTTPAYINFTATSHTVTVDISNAAAALVRVGAPGSGSQGLAMSSGTLTVGSSVTFVGGTGTKKALLSFTTGTLKVGGTITESGATDITFGTGTVEYNGGGGQTIARYNYYNLTINKSAGTATTSGNITIGNNLTVTTGTLNIAANSIDRGAAGGAFTLSSGALLQIGAANMPANYTTVSIATDSTVEYNPSFNMTVPAPGGGANYGNLLLSNSGNRAFNAAMTIAGNLTASGTVALAMNAGITVNGAFTLNSGTSMDAKAYSHTLNGNFTNNGTFTPSTSTVTFGGTAAQAISGNTTSFYNVVFNNSAGVTTSADLSISGSFTNTAGFNGGSTTTTFNGTTAQAINGPTAPTFYNLALNNTAGLTLSVNTTVSNTLTFSNGLLVTGTYTLYLSSTSSCGVSGAGSGKYVVGKLRKRFVPTTQTACTFEIGDSNATTHYTPLTVSFAAVSAGGSLTVKVSGGSGASATADDHPQIDAASLDSANSINRYWMLLPADGFTFSNASLTFGHLDDATWIDHDNSTANVTRYIVRQLTLSTTDPANCYVGEGAYDGAGSWSTATGIGTQTGTETAVTGVSSFGTYCSHFAIGRSTISSFLREREFIFQREMSY